MDADPLNDLLLRSTWLRRLALRLASDSHAADDLCQEAWHVALSTRHAIPRSPGWLAGVLRKLALHRLRDESARQRRERRAVREGHEPPSSDWLERTELQQRLIAAVLALDEPYRSTVIGRFFEEQSLEELARRQGVPGSTVRTRLARALERLREQLDRRHGGREGWAALARGFGPRATATTAASPSAGRRASLAAPGLAVAAAAALFGTLLWRSPAEPRGLVAPGEPRLPVALASEPVLQAPPRPAPAPVERSPVTSSAAVRSADTDAATPAPLVAESSWVVEGTVRDVAGSPVRGAEILWIARSLSFHSDVVTTDEEGRYRVELAGREDAAILEALGVRHRAHRAQRIEHRFTPAALDERHTTCDVTLLPGASVLVVVRDELGAPVEGTHVRLARWDEGSSGPLPYDAQQRRYHDWLPLLLGTETAAGDTDAYGECALAVAPGRHELSTWSPGTLPVSRSVKIEGDVALDVVLPRGQVVRGRVLDPLGAPVAGARVVLASAQEAVSDADGRFECGGIEHELTRISVTVDHPDFAPLWYGRTSAGDTRRELDGHDLEFTLDRGRTLEIALQDAVTSIALDVPVEVELTFDGTYAGAPTRWEHVRSLVPQDGRVHLERIGSYVTGLRVCAQGYDPRFVTLDELAPAIPVSVQPARIWTLVVTDAATGLAVPDASVGLEVFGPGTVRGASVPPPPPGSNRIAIDSRWIAAGETVVWRLSAPGYRTLEGQSELFDWPEGDLPLELEPE